MSQICYNSGRVVSYKLFAGGCGRFLWQYVVVVSGVPLRPEAQIMGNTGNYRGFFRSKNARPDDAPGRAAGPSEISTGAHRRASCTSHPAADIVVRNKT